MERLTRRSANGTGIYATPSGEPVKWENNRHNVLQKLADYEDAEEQGLLLRLPCKVGDTVYVVTSPFNVFDDIEYDENMKDEVYESYVSSVSFYESGEQYRIYAKATNHFISKMPFDSSCWIVWDKDNGNTDFADCELAWTSFSTAVRKIKYRWNGMLQQNMKHKENRIHPTQKPVALYEWLLNRYAKTGDIILDTHVGSASSLIACYRTNHPYVGFELDKHYYDLSKKRLDAEMAQMRLSDFMPGVMP